MKRVFVLLVLAAGAAFAQDSTNYYIERYPGDGIKQRPNSVPARKLGDDGISSPDRPLLESVSTNSTATVGTNGETRAARYIAPRVSSKEFAPSRLGTPRVRTVAVPQHQKKLRPSPSVSDKAGIEPANFMTTTEPASSNSAPATSGAAK